MTRTISRQMFQLLSAAAIFTSVNALAENSITTAISGVVAQGTPLEFLSLIHI